MVEAGLATASGRTSGRRVLLLTLGSTWFIALSAALLVDDFVPASDWATIEARVRDVGTRWTPTEGAWSRYGWNHPGPLLFYLLAIPYRLALGSPDLLRVGALLVSAVCVGAIVVLLRRAGRAALAIGSILVVLTTWALPEHLMVDFWNPALAVLPAAVVILASWGVLDRWAPALPMLVVSWTWCMQAHLSFGTVLLPAALAGFVVAGVEAWRDPGRRRPVLLSALVGLLLWLPAFADAVVDWPGNLWAIGTWAFTRSEPNAGLGVSLDVLTIVTDLARWPWERYPTFVNTFDASADPTLPGGLLLLLMAAAVVAARTGLRSELRLACLCLGTWAWAWVSIAQITGELLDWIFWWVHPLTACSWLSIGLVTTRVVLRRLPPLRPLSGGVGTAAVATAAALLLSTSVIAVGADFPWSGDGPAIEAFVESASTWAPGESLLVEFSGEPTVGGAVHAGLVAGLERAGRRVVVPDAFEPQFGRRRARSDTLAYPGVLVRHEVVVGDVQPGYIELAVSDPLSEAERAEVGDLIGRLTYQFVLAGWDSAAPLLETQAPEFALIGAPQELQQEERAVRRLGDLNRRGNRFVLLARPPAR